MNRRRTPRKTASAEVIPAFAEVVEWVLSLPWVVERPADARWPSVRLFAIECPPLERRRMWLMTGFAKPTPDGKTYGSDLAAVMPVEASGDADAAGWEVHWATPLPADHVLMTLAPDAEHERDDIEGLVLAAYSYAMA
jgi:hypothetical protein